MRACSGIPWERLVRRLNEYLDGLEPLLRGEEAKATGELTTTRVALEIPLEAPVRRLSTSPPSAHRCCVSRPGGRPGPSPG